MLERVLEPLCERWAWVATAVRVQKRFGELHGGYLAAAVTLTAFLALFPLLLAVIGAVGFFARNVDDLPMQVVSRLGLPPTGEAAETLTAAIAKAEESRRAATIVGFAGLLWSGLGLVAALQYAFDAVWQTSGRGFRDKLYGLGWLAGAGVLFAGSFAVTALLRLLPWVASPLALLASLALNVALWTWTFRALTNRDIGWRPFLPGAVLGAVGLEVLKLVGTVYVPQLVASSSGLYGSIGIVFATLAWLLVFGRLVVYSAVLNVVRWEEQYGTERAEIEVPSLPGADELAITRSGEVNVKESLTG